MEHPLLFTTENVIRILTCARCGKISVDFPCCHCGSEDFCKTQTRRVPIERYRNWKVRDTIIWIRETWRCAGGGDLRNIIYRAEGDSALSFCGIDDGRVGILHVPEPHWAEWDRLVYKTNRGCDWRPSIHMPRWAARIFLGITGLRDERVQEIRWQDCRAEGITLIGDELVFNNQEQKHFLLRTKFNRLWDLIDAKRHKGIYAWKKNRIVKAIEFKRRM